MRNPFRNIFNQTGFTPVLMLFSILLGLLAYITFFSPGIFKNNILSNFFPISPTHAAANVTVFNVTESASPGDLIGLQGYGFGTSPEVWMSVVNGDEPSLSPQRQLLTLTSSDIYIGAQLPTDVPFGLYAIWVKDGATESPPVFINRARGNSLEFDEVGSNQNIRVFGRNLTVPGATPSARLVDPANLSLNATIATDSSKYALKVMAPEVIPDTTYKVVITNGYGGSYGEVEVAETIKGRTSGADPFELGVPWGVDFNFIAPPIDVAEGGNVQEAIDQATLQGGGVVQLEAGNYNVGDLHFKTGVVLKGTGMNLTTLSYTRIYFDENVNTSGFMDLTFNGNGNLMYMRNNNKIFVLRSKIHHEGTDTLVRMRAAKNILTKDSVYETVYHNPFNMLHSNSYVTWKNNTLHFLRFRLSNQDGNHIIFEENHSLRDGNYPMPKLEDSGHLMWDRIDHVYIANNIFEVVGPLPILNDGETIGSQACNHPVGKIKGTATGGSSTTLVDTSKTFPNLTPTIPGYGDVAGIQVPTHHLVTLVGGPGAGQWRYITSNTTDTITFDKPWDVPPTSGTKYVITEWSANDWVITGNTFIDNPMAVNIYCGGHDLVVSSNTMTNGYAVWFRSTDIDAAGSLTGYNPIWKAEAVDNTATNDGEYWLTYYGDPNPLRSDKYTVTGITSHLSRAENQPSLHGSFVLGVEIRRNTLSYGSSGWFDEAGSAMQNIVKNTLSDTTTPGVLGTIYQGNKLTIPAADPAYRIGTGAHQTMIWDTNPYDNFLSDVPAGGASSASVGTVVIRTDQPSASPTPTPSPTSTPTPTPSPTPTPDTTPPTVSITSPANGANITRNSNFTILATASDNKAVAKVEFYVDGGLKCTDTTVSYTCRTKIGGKSNASHTITAKAYDVFNNTASMTITVTAK